MTFGLTSLGVKVKSFEDVLNSLEERARAASQQPDLDVRNPDGVLASIYNPLAEELAELWQLFEILANVTDPDRATGQSYAAVAALRGVRRKAATIGTHAGLLCTISGTGGSGQIFNRGDIRIYSGDVSNVWINSANIEVPTDGTFSVAFESELAGADKQLTTGSAVEILSAPASVQSVTIPSDGVRGSDLEFESSWRVRSDKAVSPERSSVGGAVEAISNVIAARVYEQPGKIRVVVNDSITAADSNAIAQAIWDSKSKGVIPQGQESGVAVDAFGESVTVYFDRILEVEPYVIVTLTAPSGVSTQAVKSAIASKYPKAAGLPLVHSKLVSAVQAVNGVDEVLTITIGRDPSPTIQGSLNASVSEQLIYNEARVSVVFA